MDRHTNRDHYPSYMNFSYKKFKKCEKTYENVLNHMKSQNHIHDVFRYQWKATFS